MQASRLSSCQGTHVVRRRPRDVPLGMHSQVLKVSQLVVREQTERYFAFRQQLFHRFLHDIEWRSDLRSTLEAYCTEVLVIGDRPRDSESRGTDREETGGAREARHVCVAKSGSAGQSGSRGEMAREAVIQSMASTASTRRLHRISSRLSPLVSRQHFLFPPQRRLPSTW